MRIFPRLDKTRQSTGEERRAGAQQKRPTNRDAMVTAKQLRREKEKLSEAKKKIERLEEELAKYRELGVKEEGAGGKRKRKRSSESEEGGKVASRPTEIWTMIAAKIDKNDVLAFALTSKQHREAQQQAGRKLVTRPYYQNEDGKQIVEYFSKDWCAWWSRRFNMTETMPECMKSVIRVAARYGYLDVLETYWSNLPQDKIPLLMDKWTCAKAASGGRLETLQWLRSQGCPWDQYTCAWAATHGHLKCLQWARSEGCPWNEFTCRWAARYGHLKCLQWARQNGCPWNANIMCDRAAQYGHFAILKWVREQGCPWGENTTLVAAKYGHLKCFRWLLYQGCPWNRSQCRSQGKANIRQWMQEQEDPQ